MPQVFINIIGQNAAGKTTIAQKLEKTFKLNRISGDDFRTFIYEHIAYFHDQNNSYPTQKNRELHSLVTDYRLNLLWILLAAGQNVLLDGSGFNKIVRARYLEKIRAEFPKVKTFIIWADIPETELLKRLVERDETSTARWTDMYHDMRKDSFEPPIENEADVVFRYDQTNYHEIKQKIKKVL